MRRPQPNHAWYQDGIYDRCRHCDHLRFQVQGVRAKRIMPLSLYRGWDAGGVMFWSPVRPRCAERATGPIGNTLGEQR